MHKKPKLSREDFYHQFHNAHHYRDSGDYHREVSHRRRKQKNAQGQAQMGGSDSAINKALALAARARST